MICMTLFDSIEDDSVKEFVDKYLAIRDNDCWIKSRRRHNTGIGKTLEDLLMIQENNIDEPDFGDIEIKSQRKLTSSKVTLFTKKPSGPEGANKILRDNYGIQNPKHPELKQIHTSMFNRWNTIYDNWRMRLVPYDEEERLYLEIIDLETDTIESFSCWYDYDDIREIISKKLNILAFVSADSKSNPDGTESFKFHDCCIYYGGSFERFLSLLKEGKIQYDIRIGSYKTEGKNYGKVHDHGSAFRVARTDLKKLFSGYIEI